MANCASALAVSLAPGWSAGQDAAPAPAVAAPEAPPPVIREVVVEGAQAYDLPRVLRILRIRPGDKLWRTAEQHAATLQARYEGSGYLAATVKGEFEPGKGVLRLAVDEGRLLDAKDEAEHAQVCVIGPGVRRTSSATAPRSEGTSRSTTSGWR